MEQGNEDFTQQDVKYEQALKTNGLRRVPVGNFLKLKKISFILYVYLQQISYWDKDSNEEHRYIPFTKINKTKITKELSMGRKTLNDNLQYLIDVGLLNIETAKDGCKYYILPNVGDYYVLCDFTIQGLKTLFMHLSEPLLRVFLFHKSYSIYARKNNMKEYSVPITKILECIGYSQNNKKLVIDCNMALQEVGVLDIRKESYFDDDGNVFNRNYYTYKGR